MHLMNGLLEKAAESLNTMGFQPCVFDTAREAKAAAVSLIGSESVGFGGSDTVEKLKLYEALEERGNTLYWKRKVPENLHHQTRKLTLTADWYVLSANALTTSGKIINIDGHGNRVAASIYGPPKVLFIVGRNKVVDGDLAAGLERAHNVACARLSRLRGRQTPCAMTGRCTDCHSPDRSCRATLILEKPMTMGQRIYVFLVDEDMGI